MLKIFKYSVYDLLRSRWSYIYFGFYFVFTTSLLFLSGDVSKIVISLINVLLILCPLIATMFGVMYYYNSREFVELLLAQPIKRSSVFLGQYLGVACSLSVSLLLGIGVPFLIYGILVSSAIWNFFMLLVIGVTLSFIFSAIAFWIALRNENRIKGFGLAILAWLFFAIIYDGIFLLSMIVFNDYPLEQFALGASIFNPIDLSRILILLKLDISALMGYTGAIFKQFFGSNNGMIISFTVLTTWIFLPILAIRRLVSKKDF